MNPHTSPAWLTPAQLVHALELRDLTDPQAGPHAMQRLLDELVAALVGRWGIAARTVRLGPLVAVADNYDRLGYYPDAVTRERRYTRYVGPGVMLRSHTTAGIPAVLDEIAAAKPRRHDELVVLPGLVYRRDVIDRHHVGEPHQADLWRIQRGRTATRDDLLAMAETLVEAVLPGARWRAVRATHPYTRDGHQIDVCVDGTWLELAECGIIAPGLLDRCGLDPRLWSGLALGLGLDRALMLRKQIPDIRMLRAREPRMVAQMDDLEPWRPVSLLPPMRRDLSIVLAAGRAIDGELLGDRSREILGSAASVLESLEVLAATDYDEVPIRARERLRLRPGQRNVLLRMVLRPLSETLTAQEANEIRDRLYLALHEGEVAELIG